jgi:tetratricopeptide (TPR) repeat protein
MLFTLAVCFLFLWPASFDQARAGSAVIVPPSISDEPDPFNANLQPAADAPYARQAILTEGPATVSVAGLAIPPKAAKELKLSQKTLAAGDTRVSIDHLERALKIYPNIPFAHNSLGVRYTHLGQFDRALSEFRLASAADPKSAQVLHNLGTAYYLLRRFSEAEAALRAALDLDASRLVSIYVLGNSLAMQGRNTVEAAQLLRKCTGAFPSAHLTLAKVLLGQGHPQDAAAELREYLKTPGADQKEDAARMLAKLEVVPPNHGPSED